MLDPSSVKNFVGELEAVADVDIEAPDRAKLLETVGQYDALWIHVQQRIDKEIFQQAPRLKVINTASTGTDHIDVEEAGRRGIRVLSITEDYGLLDKFTATAECAWMLIAGKLPTSACGQSPCAGRWVGHATVHRSAIVQHDTGRTWRRPTRQDGLQVRPRLSYARAGM